MNKPQSHCDTQMMLDIKQMIQALERIPSRKVRYFVSMLTDAIAEELEAAKK